MLCPCLKPEQNEDASILLESAQPVQPNLRGEGAMYGVGVARQGEQVAAAWRQPNRVSDT